MHVAPLSIATLYAQIEKASNKDMANTITHAFEQLETNQKEVSEQLKNQQKEALTQNKQETLKEINLQDLATKADIENLSLTTKADIKILKADIENLRAETKADIRGLELKMVEQKLDLHKEISHAKWQVLSGMAVLLFVQTLAKHFGLF